MQAGEALAEAAYRFGGVTVLVVGDMILDRFVTGSIERISPEAPVPVVEVVKEEDRLGGSGNVAAYSCYPSLVFRHRLSR